VYDWLYWALAERESITLITDDAKLVIVAKKKTSWLVWSKLYSAQPSCLPCADLPGVFNVMISKARRSA
jgi:hypothetical protein